MNASQANSEPFSDPLAQPLQDPLSDPLSSSHPENSSALGEMGGGAGAEWEEDWRAARREMVSCQGVAGRVAKLGAEPGQGGVLLTTAEWQVDWHSVKFTELGSRWSWRGGRASW